MFEQRTLKSLAEQIHQMRGSIGQVPKPKDKPTAIKILEKLIEQENASFTKKTVEADKRLSETPFPEEKTGVLGIPVNRASVESNVVEHTTTHHVTVETVHTVTTNTVVTDKIVQEDINVIVHGTSNRNGNPKETRESKLSSMKQVVEVKPVEKTHVVRKMNEQPHCRFNEKKFTLLMDNSVQHKTIVDSFPTQARLLLLAWKKNEKTVTGDRLIKICEKDGPRGNRSAKLIIQRYMTYFVREGLVAYGESEEKVKHA